MDDHLGLFDAVSRRELLLEINSLKSSGIPITIGQSDDEAYDHPDEIRAVFERLRVLDRQLAEVPEPTPSWWHAPKARKHARRAGHHAKDRHRIDWLYGPMMTDSLPWYEQKGRAAALLTITAAHELSDETGVRAHRTMSGPLDKRVLDHRFEDAVPHIGGLELADGVARVESSLLGREIAAAHVTAQRRVVQLAEFVEAPVTSRFRQIVRFCTDSLGIRSRKQLVAQRIHHALDMTDVRQPLMMSFGCGTALPMLEVLAAEKARSPERTPRLILLDQDPLALACASTLASDMGLNDHIEVHCARLFDRWGRPVDLQSVLKGRHLDIAEDSGLREYLPDRIYRWLTKETWRALAPGGLMSTGNMNKSRPQREFLHGMMGWQPHVHMRTIQRGLDLHAAAGVPRSHTSTTITPEGVYSLFFSVKPHG